MRDDFGNEKNATAVHVPPQPNYTTSSETPMEAGKVLAIAGGAAGAIAGLWVLVSERDKKSEPKTTMEQARALIQEAAEKAKHEGSDAGSTLLSNVETFRADAEKKGKKRKKKASRANAKLRKKAEAEGQDVVDRLSRILKDTGEDIVKNYGPEVAALVSQFRNDATHRIEDAKKRSDDYSRVARKDAKKARGEAAALASNLKSKAVDAEHQAEHYVEGVVVPKLKNWSHEAQSVFGTGKERSEELRKKAEKELLPEAKKRAEELRSKAEGDLLPEAKKRAEALRKKAESDLLPEAKKRAEELSHTFEDRARNAKESWGETSADAAEKLHAVSETVEHQASEAGEAVKRGGRETRSLLLWVALAGVLIFTVFLDEDQQKRLKEIAYEIFGEAKDMYGDMKGDDSSLSM